MASRRDDVYAKLSPEKKADRDRGERIGQIDKRLRATGLDQLERDELNDQLRQLIAEHEAAHPEMVDAQLDMEVKDQARRQLAVMLGKDQAAQDYAERTASGEEEACPEVDWADVNCDDDGEPMICLRTDGVGLIYEGHSNALISLSGAGKTWLLIHAALEVIARGWDANMIDFEDDARRFKLRVSLVARARGLDLDDILKHLHYRRPRAPLNAADIAKITERGAECLVLVDGIGKALAAYGLKNDEDGVMTLDNRLIRPLSDQGGTVFTADHTPKNKDNQDTPLGSVQKMNQVTGALLILRAEKKMGVNVKGSSGIFLTSKDRGGRLTEHAAEDHGELRIATLEVDATQWGEVAVTLNPPAGAEARQQTKLMRLAQQASEILERLDDDDWITQTLDSLADNRKNNRVRTMLERRKLNKTNLARLMGGNNTEAADGIKYLLELDPPHVVQEDQTGRGRGTWLQLVRPYRAPAQRF